MSNIIKQPGDIAGVAFIVCIFLSIVLFVGEPDLLDCIKSKISGQSIEIFVEY